MSYQLSLEETADSERDVVIEVDGISFVAERGQQHLLPGLRVEVRRVFGREGLFASNELFQASGC